MDDSFLMSSVLPGMQDVSVADLHHLTRMPSLPDSEIPERAWLRFHLKIALDRTGVHATTLPDRTGLSVFDLFADLPLRTMDEA